MVAMAGHETEHSAVCDCTGPTPMESAFTSAFTSIFNVRVAYLIAQGNTPTRLLTGSSSWLFKLILPKLMY